MRRGCFRQRAACFFIDEQYAKKFNDDKTTGTLAGLFSGLTIFISCLGLFGLSAYMAEKRVKEIGVRKVLGASVMNITTLLSMDFIKLVVIAFVIAAPIGYWAMSWWLQKFEFKIEISLLVFALAGLVSFAIAWITVGFESIRAALGNPIDSLRSE